MAVEAREHDRGVHGKSYHVAAWSAWSLVTLSAASLMGGITLAQMAPSTAPQRPYYGPVDAVLTLATVLTFSLVGAFIASRQPRNAIGWLFCGIGLAMGLNGLAGGYAEYRLSNVYEPWSLAETAAWFSSWSWTLLVFVPTTFLLLLFPDGRLPSPRWRPVAWCATLGTVGCVVGYALQAGPLDDFPQITNPYGVDNLVLEVVVIAGAILASASMVASAISLIDRMRRAGRVARQQVKWIAYGGTVVVVAVFIGVVIAIWSPNVSISVIGFSLLVVPVFTGVAMARYRLYDIDIVINRTLVYGALTTALVAVYFGSTVLLQSALRFLTGQESALAVVASTLTIAALFNAVRRRVQRFVDRRFYRRKYDARKTLDTFSGKLRDETDLETLNDDLVGVVRETVQPRHVGLWLAPSTDARERWMEPAE